jgi:syntaxin-binding protein 1
MLLTLLAFCSFVFVHFRSVKSKLSTSSSFDEESEYASSRYSPPLKAILNELATNQLSIDEYPSVIPMPLSVTSQSTVSGSARRRGKGPEGSLRKSKAGPTDKWSKLGTSQAKPPTNGANYTGGRNLVFMVGGMSYSELRVARDIMERESREIITGSTKFVDPSEFLEDLHTLAG